MYNKKFLHIFLLVIFISIIYLTFKNWFFLDKIISSGDYPYFFKENMDDFLSVPLSWNGGYYAPYLSSYPLTFITGLLSHLGFGYALIERIVWFFPSLLLTLFSSWYLSKTIFQKGKSEIWIASSFIYTFNTFILMLIGGGQVGIILSYSMAPLVLSVFIRSIQNPKWSSSLLSGLFLALQIISDPRIAFITMISVILYLLCFLKINFNKYFQVIILPLIIAVEFHFYWLLPTLLTKKSVLPLNYGSTSWIDFLSFATLSNTLSLLHPNWPENIFGKTYFMKPEFLIIPVIAFSSLFFLKKKIRGYGQMNNNTKNILFFSFLALLGAFLAKGSKPPLGGIYYWVFNNLPGMNMFRDPIKFYLLVALSYSMLIPFSFFGILQWLKEKFHLRRLLKHLPSVIFFFIVVYFLFLASPAWMGNLTGTFKVKSLPEDYLLLKEFLSKKPNFYRTLWIPSSQRFGYYSLKHPEISATIYFGTNDLDLITKNLQKKNIEDELRRYGIKYLIIPDDTEGEIFLRDRKYDQKVRQNLEQQIGKIKWLNRINTIKSGITVFALNNPKDHFWFRNNKNSISFVMINPAKYLVTGNNISSDRLLFSEDFDSNWILKIGDKIVSSRNDAYLNSFSVGKIGRWQGVVEYSPQKYVYYGLGVSILTIIISGTLLIYCAKKKI